MSQALNLSYYLGCEAEQYAFYRIPKLLITDERFRSISVEAKLLYGMMLDRMSLSIKNGWLDEQNRIYIHFTVLDVMELLHCQKQKAIKLLDELDCAKGIGLIERIRKRQGNPSMIYVKNFTAQNK